MSKEKTVLQEPMIDIDEVSVDVIDSFDTVENGKPTVKYIFTYRCFCGTSAPKGTMYAHLVNDHGLPAGVIQMILNMSPMKRENAPESNDIKP